MNTAKFRYLFPLIGTTIVLLNWWINPVLPDQLVYDVSRFARFSLLETHWLYALVLLCSFLPVFALSWDRKVAYYRSWRQLFPAITAVALVFVGWDVFFTIKEVWEFNSTYYYGWRLAHLPIEEWLFFFIVPFCSIFIYECLNAYFPTDHLAKADFWLTPTLGSLALLIGLIYWQHMYTATTFLLTGGFLLFHFWWFENTYRTRFLRAYVLILIPFLMVNGVLTGGFTEQPVVVYNPDEYLGIRIQSVPLDDSVYGFLMLFAAVTLLENARNIARVRGRHRSA